VAAIAGVGDAAIEHVADERFHLRNDCGERVPVIGVADRNRRYPRPPASWLPG
jgi:hypothetical protein